MLSEQPVSADRVDNPAISKSLKKAAFLQRGFFYAHFKLRLLFGRSRDAREKVKSVAQMLFPICPGVSAGIFDKQMRDIFGPKGAMQIAIVLDQFVIDAAIESQRRQLRAIVPHPVNGGQFLF